MEIGIQVIFIKAEARKNFKNVQEIHAHDSVIQDFEAIKVEASSYFSEL